MPETIYSSYPNDPNRIDVKEYDHPDGERGAIHYYQQQPDGSPKHISGDEFAEYMHPGALEERRKDIEDHAEEAKEWVRLERENKLINDKGRRVNEDGKVLFPTRPEKAKEKAGELADRGVEGAKKGVEALAKLKAETKDAILTALAANEIEQAREIMRKGGVELEDLRSNDGNTLIAKPEGAKKDEPKTGKAIFHAKKGDRKVIVTGLSPDFPNGIDPKDGKRYYAADGDGYDLRYTRIPAEQVEFSDDSAAVTVPEVEAKSKSEQEIKNSFAQNNPEAVLRLQEEVKKRYKKAESELTSFDLSIDPSIKRNIEEQIRGKVVDEYISGLPEDEQEEAKKNKKEILEALKMNPEKLEAIRKGKNEVDPNTIDLPVLKDGEVIFPKKPFSMKVVNANGNEFILKGKGDDSFEGEGYPLSRDEAENLVKGTLGGGFNEKPKELDAKTVEASMKRVEELNAELKTAIEASDLEKAKEIQAKIDAEMKKMRGTLEAANEVKEISTEEAQTIVVQRKEGRWKRAVQRFKEWARHPILGTYAALMSRGAGDGGSDDEVSASSSESSGGGDIPGEGEEKTRKVTVVEEETKEKREKDRRSLAGFAAGGLAVAAGGVLTYFLMRQGHPTEVIQQFIAGKNNFINNGHDMTVNIAGHAQHLQHLHHIDFESLRPSTIHATSPDQFHNGVLSLLSRQGVSVHAATPEKLHHMTEWMQTHEQVASGMREGEHHLVQNLTAFPDAGQHFANANVSASQGFQIGADGSGKAALIEYAKEAQRIGLIG